MMCVADGPGAGVMEINTEFINAIPTINITR